MLKFTPMQMCIICRHTLKQVGGRRIVATHFMGLVVERARPLRRLPKSHMVFRIGKNGSYQFRSWGKLINELPFNTIATAIGNGLHPWICQQCAGYSLCSKCRAPLTWPQGADVLDDEGMVTHCMIVPAQMPCSNTRCENYRENEPVKGGE